MLSQRTAFAGQGPCRRSALATVVVAAAVAGWVARSAAPVHAALTARPAAAGQCSTATNQMVREAPWTQKRLAPQRAWEITAGEGVVVCVIDTGFDA